MLLQSGAKGALRNLMQSNLLLCKRRFKPRHFKSLCSPFNLTTTFITSVNPCIRLSDRKSLRDKTGASSENGSRLLLAMYNHCFPRERKRESEGGGGRQNTRCFAFMHAFNNRVAEISKTRTFR